MRKIKISELPLYSSLKGLFTIGTDAQNRSVRVSLEFVEEQTNKAVTDAQEATEAANEAAKSATLSKENADKATKAATAAAQTANTAAGKADTATREANTATEAAKTATKDANDATEDAKAATASANAAKEAADKATDEARKATTDAQEATDDVLAAFAKLIPTSMTVKSITRITLGNKTQNYICVDFKPENTAKNVIFISDNKAVSVGTDGRLTVVGKGKSTVHVIPTLNTALAKTLLIEVVPPVLRLVTAGSLRFIHSGGFRLV